MPPQPLVAGRYRVRGELGRGGQGRVLRAEGVGPARDLGAVALKTSGEERPSPALVEVLRAETERLRAVSHPGLVELIDFTVDEDGRPWLVSRLVEGRPFLEAARDEDPLRLAAPVLRALEHLHAAGFCHLDVKPENLLVPPEGGPVLLDLGLAARAGEVARRGTPGYAAPEVAIGDPVDRRADLYSLGATLARACGAPAPPALGAPDLRRVPQPARDLLARLLQPSRTARPHSAGAALALLAEALGEPLEPPRAGPLPPVEGPLEGCREALARLRAPGALAIRGPRGCGRSRLLREAAAAARGEGAQVFFVAFRGPERSGPHGALTAFLTRLGVPLSAAALELASAPEMARARVLVEACRRVAEEARRTPLVLALDDLDAAPDDALEVVAALARAPAPGLRLWASWPTAVERTALARLERTLGAARRLDLPPRPTPGAASDGQARSPAQLPASQRALLRALALLAAPADPALLVRLDPQAPAHLDALRAAGLVQVLDGGVVPTPAGGRAVAGDGDAAGEAALAGRLLTALEEAPAPAAGDARARLALRAGDASRAAPLVLGAAEEAVQRGALAAAEELLAGLEALDPDPADAARAGALRAQVDLARGDEERGLARLEAVREAAAAPPALRAAAAARAARRLYRAARDDEALALAARAEELLGDAEAPDVRCDVTHVRSLVAACQDPRGFTPDPEALERLRRAGARGGALAHLGSGLGIVLYRANRLGEAEELLQRAREDGRRAGDLQAEGWALLNLGVCRQRAGQAAAARQDTVQARALLERAGDVVGVATTDLESGLRLLRASRYRACRELLGPVLETFLALGDEPRVAELRMNLGAAALRLGDLEAARELLAEAVTRLQEPGLVAFCEGDLALLEAEAGRAQEARAHLSWAAARAAEADAFFALQAGVQRAAALLRLRALDPAGPDQPLPAAREALAAVRAGEARDLLPAAAVTLAEAALAAGREAADADDLLQEAGQAAAAALAAGQGSDHCRAFAARAGVELERGDLPAARASAEQALALAAASDDLFDRAAAITARARLDLAQGRPQEAARRLRPLRAAARAAGLRTLEAELVALLAPHAPPSAAALEVLEGLAAGGAGGPGSGGQGTEGSGGLLARVVAEAPDAGHMLDLSLGLLVEATGAERGLLVLLDEAGRPTETAARNIRGEELAGPQFSYSRRLVEEAARTGEPVLIRDALVDPRFTEAESVATLAIRSVLAIPVRAEDGGPVLSALYLDDRAQPGRFGPEALELAARMTGELAPALRLVRERVHLERDVAGLRSQVEAATRVSTAGQLIGASAPLRRLRQAIARAARADLPVLIEGESGSGKELVARAIHAGGPRARGPFVAESCAAVADHLLESELFGHVRGAFTGADRDRDGIFAAASGGTLLLDEVNSMSPSMQAKLLRVLQEGVVRAVGAEQTRAVDVRVIAAANEPLRDLVEAGRFRQDLYYRLAVMVVQAPPLRERPDDIPLLADHFLRAHAGEAGPPPISEPALRTLLAYPWPGNVRELENAMRRVLALRVPRVLVRHLPAEVAAHAKDARPGQDPVEGAADLPLGEALERVERDLILRALRRTGGNVSQAARALEVERTKLIRRLKKLGIDPKRL